jgi:hypothetical protein
MGIAPVGAVEKALKRSKKELSDIDVFELNEAFANAIAPPLTFTFSGGNFNSRSTANDCAANASFNSC